MKKYYKFYYFLSFLVFTAFYLYKKKLVKSYYNINLKKGPIALNFSEEKEFINKCLKLIAINYIRFLLSYCIYTD